MEPKAILFNGKVVVAVPDHIEEVMVLRKSDSFVFNLPKDRNIFRTRDERIIDPITD